jgi:hypothetical protein
MILPSLCIMQCNRLMGFILMVSLQVFPYQYCTNLKPILPPTTRLLHTKLNEFVSFSDMMTQTNCTYSEPNASLTLSCTNELAGDFMYDYTAKLCESRF